MNICVPVESSQAYQYRSPEWLQMITEDGTTCV